MAVLGKKAARMPPFSWAGGFTLIELVMVMVLIGILAIVVLPRLDNSAFSEYGYAEETLSALRYARQTAIARNSEVTVALAAHGFRICLGGSCPVAGGSYLANPAKARPWDGAALGGGKAPDGVSIVTGLGEVTFDGLGRPSVAGTLSIGSHTLTIEPDTGYVH